MSSEWELLLDLIASAALSVVSVPVLGHSNSCAVVSCCFDLRFSDDIWCGAYRFTYFIVFHLLHLTGIAVFTDWSSVAALLHASLLITIFLIALASSLCLCHILVILTVFQTFSLLLYYGDLWSVFFGVTNVIVLGSHWNMFIQDDKLNRYKLCVFWLPHWRTVPPTPFPQSSSFLEMEQYWN